MLYGVPPPYLRPALSINAQDHYVLQCLVNLLDSNGLEQDVSAQSHLQRSSSKNTLSLFP